MWSEGVRIIEVALYIEAGTNVGYTGTLVNVQHRGNWMSDIK